MELKFFIQEISTSLNSNRFVKLVLSKPLGGDVKKVTIKNVIIKKQKMLSFVLSYKTKDITKNYPRKTGLSLIETTMKDQFQIANLFTNDYDLSLTASSDGSYASRKLKATFPDPISNSHDKLKDNHITQEGYLIDLGILDKNNRVVRGAGNKLKQIRKYNEILGQLIKNLSKQYKENTLKIMDMGSGKGYLSFALYDLLKNKLSLDPMLTGIELRPELVAQCNGIASKYKFEKLNFKEGTIMDQQVDQIDILIALHACDTATDDAIFKGIKAGAELIICAPCCHRQVRKSMTPGAQIEDISQHGILFERQAEILTDTIRSLIMEAHGYQTKVIEFISTEHTGKNLMIIGTRKSKAFDKAIYIDKIGKLQSLFGLEQHYLVELLRN